MINKGELSYKGTGVYDKPIDISVIVIQYNPIYKKLISTLKSIINQQAVAFEIVISDDGSKEDYFQQIKEYFDSVGFDRYKLVKSGQNAGTVHNCLNGVEYAEGKYVKAISPGDYLYEKGTLRDIFSYMEKNQAQALYGDAVYYSYDGSDISTYDLHEPKFSTGLYDGDDYSNKKVKKSLLIYNDFILGATLAFERKALQYSLNMLDGTVKYMEDMSSVILAMDNIRIFHIKQYIVWYEYGSGISTSKSDVWKERLDKDYRAFLGLLGKTHKTNLMVKQAIFLRAVMKSPSSLAYKLLRAVKRTILHSGGSESAVEEVKPIKGIDAQKNMLLQILKDNEEDRYAGN